MDERERAVTVGIDTGEYDCESSMAELKALADTAGAEIVGTLTQRRDSLDKATAIGSGRLTELAALAEANDAELIIFDHELSATQLRNLEDALPCRVIDRTMLILDIFAGRARSAEGRLQVELAQLEYLLPRQAGMGTELSRLGGGIGTRGPGETKLETNKRHIRRRIQALKRQLETVEKQRNLRRARRKKDQVLTVALVGYTNAGKSTLMNRLTDAGVWAEDQLFATLDTTARALRLPDGRTVLLVDTVGLVRRLPHHLVEAFHSTLEEAALADVILNICDASAPEAAEHLAVTRELLEQLGCADRPIITVYNKCDRAGTPLHLQVGDPNAVWISALKGGGIEILLDAIAAALPKDRKRVTMLIPYRQGALAERCRREGAVESEEYTPEGIKMTATIGGKELRDAQAYIL
ncbi:MAG: GTPase HflX [Clostridia bacterium]|nr:GTPase HflX [Clostridia bacterium]